MEREIESGEDPTATDVIVINKDYDDRRKAENKRKHAGQKK